MKCNDRRTADSGSSDHASKRCAPSKVDCPVFCAWIEEVDLAAGERVSKSGSCLFVVIAPETAKAQIVETAGAALGFRNNVIDREIVSGVVHVRATVFAVTPRSFANTPPQRRRDSAHTRLIASARRSMTRSDSCSNAVNSCRSARLSLLLLDSVRSSSTLACFCLESR